jgi:hypothetical protein
LRVFVQRFVVNVAKPKIAVSLTTVGAAVFRHPAAAMESVSPNTDGTDDLSFSISRYQRPKKLDYPSLHVLNGLNLCYTTTRLNP